MAIQTEINFSDLTKGKVVAEGTDLQWKGTGVFDKLMEAVNKNIKIQYDEGKIKGTDYANVYLGSLQTVLQQSIEFILREKLVEAQIEGVKMDNIVKEFEIEVKIPKELELLDKQVELAAKELELKTAQTALLAIQQREMELNGVKERAAKDAQTSLYIRQEQGFDDNKFQKLFEAQMSAWGLMFSSGMTDKIPKLVTSDAASHLYNSLRPAGVPPVPV